METARTDESNNFTIMTDNPLPQEPTNAEDMEDVETSDEKTPHEFSSPWNFSDVVLVVEDTKFHVHKCILSLWSPVFSTMFTSQFKESTAKEIPLPEKRADEVEQLLKLIYFDDTKQKVTETNYKFLLELARQYQMDRVRKRCEQYMKQDINDQNCLRRCKIADHFGLEDVIEKCNEEARFKSSTDLEESEDFLELGFESKFKLCMARLKELEKALTQYADICSNLVTGFNKELSGNMPVDISKCDNKISHKSGMFRQDFDWSCRSCRNTVGSYGGTYKGKRGVINVNAVRLSDHFIKLYELEHNSKVEKIIENLKK